MAKAFDKVNHFALAIRQTFSPVVNMLVNWYNISSAIVRWHNVYSAFVRLQCGVRQGVLFAVYVNDNYSLKVWSWLLCL